MASKSKGKSLLFEALSTSAEATKDKVNVYEVILFYKNQYFKFVWFLID